MRNAITLLELAITGALAIAVAAYIAHGALLMSSIVL